MAVTPNAAGKGITPSWDLVRPSLKLVLMHSDKVIFLFLIPTLVLTLASILLGEPRDIHLDSLTTHQIRGFAVLGLGGLLSLINMAPSLYFRVAAPKNPRIGLGEIYRKGYGYFWRLVGLYLLFALAVLAGLILLIVPGFVVVFLALHWYYLAPYYLVEHDLTIREALRKCKQESAPFRPFIWGIIGVQLVFGIIASLFTSLLFQAGGILSAFIGLICLFLPALRYYEIKRTAA